VIKGRINSVGTMAALVHLTFGNKLVAEGSAVVGSKTAARNSQCDVGKSPDILEVLFGSKEVAPPPQNLYPQKLSPPLLQDSDVRRQILRFTQQSKVQVLKFVSSSAECVEYITMLVRASRIAGETRRGPDAPVNPSGDSQTKNWPGPTALVPNTRFVPRLASLRGRAAAGTRSCLDSDMPTYVVERTTGNASVVRFNRTAKQYLDRGPQMFHIETRAGFTTVAEVLFTGLLWGVSASTDGWNKLLFGFGSATAPSMDMTVFRDAVTGIFMFEIWESSNACLVSSATAIMQDTSYAEIVVKYAVQGATMKIKVNAKVEVSVMCTTPRTDQKSPVTYVGWSADGACPLNADVKGLFAIDTVLTDAETSVIRACMTRGQDTLSQCDIYPAGQTAHAGSRDVQACVTVCLAGADLVPRSAACQCNAGYSGLSDACAACPTGTLKAVARNTTLAPSGPPALT